MLQHKIREAFCASISRNPKGYQYLRTSDFVNYLRFTRHPLIRGGS